MNNDQIDSGSDLNGFEKLRIEKDNAAGSGSIILEPYFSSDNEEEYKRDCGQSIMIHGSSGKKNKEEEEPPLY